MKLYKEEREFLRKRTSKFFAKNPISENSKIINHSLQEGFARMTIYNNIKSPRGSRILG